MATFNISLTDDRRARLTEVLRDEVLGMYRNSYRASYLDNFRNYIRRYEAKTSTKRFPYAQGSSNIHIPFAATAVDSIKTRILNALKAQPDRLITVEPLTEEEIPDVTDPVTGQALSWRDVAELLETYFAYEISASGEIDFEGAIDELLDEVCLFGTGWMKTVWETRTEREWNTAAGKWEDRTIRDNVRFIIPAIEDVLFPANYPDIERIPWISHLYVARPSEILQRAGTLPGQWDEGRVRDFLDQFGGPVGGRLQIKEPAHISPLQEEQAAIEKVDEPIYYRTGEIQLAETWLRFALDDNRYEVKILVDHSLEHPEHIFNVRPWPYQHQRLPFVIGRYIRRRKRIYGMGVVERCESIDEGISTQVNQMIDNVTLANTRLWKGKADSPAIQALASGPYPNQVIALQDMSDLEPIQMGEVYPSIFELGNILREYGERVVKLSDYNLGRESQALGRQSTATATLALLQESGQYYDGITREIRVAVNEALQQMLDLMVQFRPLSRMRAVLGAKADILLAAISLPIGDLRKRIGVRVAFSSTAASRELARQEEIAKFGVLKEHYAGLLQLEQERMMALNGNPQMGLPPDPGRVALIDEIARHSGSEAARILETFGDRATENLPSWGRTVLANSTGPRSAGGSQVPGGVTTLASPQAPNGGPTPPLIGAIRPSGSPPGSQ